MKPSLNRRSLVGLLGMGAIAPLWSGVARASNAESAVTPDEALERLKKGNAAFAKANKLTINEVNVTRLEVAKGQTPYASFLTCADSRVAPELLFNTSLGELFVVRDAGNSVDTGGLGSLLYSVLALKVSLVVVMGHERCGAAKAAVDLHAGTAQLPQGIIDTITPIVPAVSEALKSNPADVADATVRVHVRRQVERLRADSQLAPLIASGKLKVVGAYYDLDHGTVTFSET